ncbi:phytosulfokine receptor 2-like [Miscanthus floridulus]|uniref:phytosulfokine receptor 2-like n=1 Tax=Miscanthus floridulus TaxID=154761 RepID=UPI00345B1BF1
MAPKRAPLLLLPPLLLLQLLIPRARAAANPDPAPCHPDDLRTLLAFAGNLTSAADAFLWPSSSSSAPGCCAWDGVSCDAGGRMSALRLPARGLAGPLPSPVLTALSFLQDLDLSWNTLTGAVAAALTALPGTIHTANLSSNLLHGVFPGVPLPDHLDASNNSIFGPLAPDLCASALVLRVLDLSTNRLTGALLSSSSASPPPYAATLRELSLANNAFTHAARADVRRMRDREDTVEDWGIGEGIGG